VRRPGGVGRGGGVGARRRSGRWPRRSGQDGGWLGLLGGARGSWLCPGEAAARGRGSGGG
jgi:hypothetical protein